MNIQIKAITIFAILAAFTFIFKDLTSMTNKAIYYPQFVVEVISIISLPFLIHKIREYEVLLGLLVLIMLSQYILHRESFRISTVLYTLLLGGTFAYFARLIDNATLKVYYFKRFVKFSLALLSVVLFIQQVQSIIGVEVFNIVSDMSSKFKLNSLAKESSKLALTAPLLLFLYTSVREIEMQRDYVLGKDFYKDKVVWVLALYLGFTCGSMTAFIAFPVFMLKFVEKKNYWCPIKN